jgi:hypothetical protein
MYSWFFQKDFWMWIQTCRESAREVHDEEMDDTCENKTYMYQNIYEKLTKK